MSLSIYLFLHICGLIMLALSLGAILMARKTDDRKHPNMLSVMHGLGLLLLLVAGFGMLARYEIGWPWPLWIWLKIAIWLILGAFPALVKRFDAQLGWYVVLGLIVVSAFLGIMKPF